jgi:hypothetical protein
MAEGVEPFIRVLGQYIASVLLDGEATIAASFSHITNNNCEGNQLTWQASRCGCTQFTVLLASTNE